MAIESLMSTIKQDETTMMISQMFDYEFTGTVIKDIYVPDFPTDFNVGVIVGSSGSGKTFLLNKCFGEEDAVVWDNSKCIASNFGGFREASDKLGASGLNSIPSWLKPYCVLSTGEKFRADLAMRIKDFARIDEFTSVVNRSVAISCSISIRKYITQNKCRNVVLSTCHYDIVPFLEPDWVYDTDLKKFTTNDYKIKPKLLLEISDGSYEDWDMFKAHHYLSGSLNKSGKCYICTVNGIKAGFASIISMPCGTVKNAYREHRIVVLPDYQGMGIGTWMSEKIGQTYVDNGYRYFSKTANPRMGEHRDKSNLWLATSKNHKKRPDYDLLVGHGYNNMNDSAIRHSNRMCYSHEYIGTGGRE